MSTLAELKLELEALPPINGSEREKLEAFIIANIKGNYRIGMYARCLTLHEAFLSVENGKIVKKNDEGWFGKLQTIDEPITIEELFSCASTIHALTHLALQLKIRDIKRTREFISKL